MIPKRIDINDRSDVADLRSRLGDLQGDIVYWQEAHLVILIDRKSRSILIVKVDTKHAEIIADSYDHIF